MVYDSDVVGKKRLTIGKNVKLVYDESLEVDDFFVNALSDVSHLLEANSGQNIWAVYLNEDKDLPGNIFSMVIKFEKKVR